MVLRKLLPALAAVVLVGCSAGSTGTPSSVPDPTDGPVQSSAAVSPGPAASGMDAGQRSVLLDRIGADGGVDRELALTAFSWTFGPIDGVDVETRPADDPGIEPSLAIRWFMRYRDTLPADVVAAAEAAYSPAGESVTVAPEDIVAADPQGLDLVQVIEQGVVLHRFAGGRVEPTLEQLRSMVTVAAKELSTASGATLNLALAVVKNATDERVDGQDRLRLVRATVRGQPRFARSSCNPSLFVETAADIAGRRCCTRSGTASSGTTATRDADLCGRAWITEGQAEYVVRRRLRSVAPVLARRTTTSGSPPRHPAVQLGPTTPSASTPRWPTLVFRRCRRCCRCTTTGSKRSRLPVRHRAANLSAMTDQWASSYADDPDYGSAVVGWISGR